MNRVGTKNHVGETDNLDKTCMCKQFAGNLRDIQQVQISYEIQEINDEIFITLDLMISLKHSLKNRGV